KSALVDAEPLGDVIRRGARAVLRSSLPRPESQTAGWLGYRLLPGRGALRAGLEGAGAAAWKYPQRARQIVGPSRLVGVRRAHPSRDVGPDRRCQHAALQSSLRRP